MQPHTTGAREARADLVLARDLITRAVQAESVAGLDDAAAMIDRALRAMCPHDETTWDSRADDHGLILTTCDRCDVSWHEHMG
jgi:hypothetical protein